MARRNQTLELVLSGNSRGAENAIDRVDNRTGRFNKTLGRAAKAAGLFVAALGIAAVAAGVHAVKAYAELGDQIHKMSLRTGFATETLSELNHAAQLSGTTLGNFDGIVKKMFRSIYDANRGLAETQEAFTDIGLSAAQLEGLSPEDTFLKIAGALAQVEDHGKKAALAQILFGRQGMALLPMLEHGAEGLHEMMQEARDLGIVMSQEDAEAAAEFNDNMLRLQARIDAVKFTIARHLVPALIELQNWLGPRITQSVRWLVDMWDNRLQPALSAGVAQIRELGAALGFLEGGGETELHPALQWIADNQETLQVVGAIAAGILAAVIAFKAFMAAVAGVTAVVAIAKGIFLAVTVAIGAISIPVLIVVAAIAALVAGFILLYTRSDGFRSFIHDKLLPALGRLAEWFGTKLPQAFEAVKQWVDRYITPAMEAIWIKAQEAWEKLSPILAAIRDAVIATLGRAVSWVRAHWEPISTVLKAPFLLAWLGIVATLDMIKTAVEIALQLITGDWEGAIDSLAGYVERSKERMIEAFKVLLDVGEVLHAAGQALGQKILEGMALALGSIGDVIGGAVGGAFSGIGLPDINIPGFAAGGVVPATPGGRIVRVGEGGRDEAIVPLGRGGGAGGNTYITVDAALGDPDAIADRLYPVLQALERRGTISIITAGA